MTHVEGLVIVPTPLSDMAMLTQMKPAATRVIKEKLWRELLQLEAVGLSWTTLSKISNLPDVNERLVCIPWIVQAIASGSVSLTVVGDHILFSGAGLTEFPRASNEPDITVLIRTR